MIYETIYLPDHQKFQRYSESSILRPYSRSALTTPVCNRKKQPIEFPQETISRFIPHCANLSVSDFQISQLLTHAFFIPFGRNATAFLFVWPFCAISPTCFHCFQHNFPLLSSHSPCLRPSLSLIIR